MITLPRVRAYGRSAGRPGVTTVDGRVPMDGLGASNPLGLTFFCGLALYQQDKAKLRAELSAAAGTFDFVRVLGVVGHRGNPDEDSWSDRTVDPRDHGYDDDIAGFTDLCFDEFGIKVHWAIFGEVNDAVPDLAAQAAVVDRFARMAQGRENKIFIFEIANEGYDNGYSNETLRALAVRLQSKTSVLVTASTPNPYVTSDPEALYGGLSLRMATWHVPRDEGDGGLRDPLWKPWEWCNQFSGVPSTFVNGEPPGYRSTGTEFSDYRMFIAAYAINQLCGGFAYVFHNSVGLRLGGQWDQRRQMPSRLVDTPNWDAICGAYRKVKESLPVGVQNWTRHNGHWISNPIQIADRAQFDNGGIFKAVCATDGSRVAYGALWVRRDQDVIVSRRMILDEIDLATGDPFRRITVNAGGSFTLLAAHPDALFVGRFD